MAFSTIVRTLAGTILARPVTNGWVADLPIRPSSDTSTSSPGNTDWMP